MPAIIQSQRYCPHCKETRLFVKPGVNHLLHLIVTLFTCGCWVVVWIIAAMNNTGKAAKCNVCGGKP